MVYYNSWGITNYKSYIGGICIMARPKKYVDPNTTAQNEANKAWQEKNKEYNKYLNYRSRTRTFIRTMATEDDIDDLLGMIEERKKAPKPSE